MITASRFTFCMLRHLQYSKTSFQKANLCVSAISSSTRCFSTEKLHEETDVIVKEKIHLKRSSITKWKRPLFVQNFFAGKFDTHLLAFPQILDKDHLQELEKYVMILNEIYKTKVNSLKIDEDQKIPSDVMQELKDLGACGRFVPSEYNGLNFTYTEYARLNEAIGLDWSIGSILNIHELVCIKALSLMGSEEQKSRYLPDLASGKKLATFCYHEQESGSDASSCKTKVDFSSDGSNYVLTGVKTWVANAADADLYLVFAKTSKKGDSIEGDPLFLLIDKNTPGVKVSLISENTSLRGTGVGVIQFDEVVVPFSNVLGETGSGYPLLNKLLENLRFGIGSLYIGTLKTFLDHVTEYVINTERLQKPLANYDLVKFRLSKIQQMIYAMESITYYTAAIYDSTENPDCGIESAIMKVHNSEGALYCLQELIKVVGVLGLAKSQQLERFYRDAQGMAMLDSPNDIIRLFIGLSGTKYSASLRHKEVEEWRNPFTYPWQHIQFGRKYYKIRKKKFSFDQDIAGHIHPSLVFHGNSLEESVQMLDACVNSVLKDYGRVIVDLQIDPCRLADMSINLYVMAAVLARASRSYCIGLRNNDQEVKTAMAICREARVKIDRDYENITSGFIQNYDQRHLGIGEHVIDLKGYFPEHPLKHNW